MANPGLPGGVERPLTVRRAVSAGHSTPRAAPASLPSPPPKRRFCVFKQMPLEVSSPRFSTASSMGTPRDSPRADQLVARAPNLYY